MNGAMSTPFFRSQTALWWASPCWATNVPPHYKRLHCATRSWPSADLRPRERASIRACTRMLSCLSTSSEPTDSGPAPRATKESTLNPATALLGNDGVRCECILLEEVLELVQIYGTFRRTRVNTSIR